MNNENTDTLRAAFIERDDEFWGILPGGEGCEFESSGLSGVVCTGYAIEIRNKLGADRVKVLGFLHADNPGTLVGRLAGGHDFAVVDDRFLVDPWLVDVECQPVRGVYDLEDEGDAGEIVRIYGHRWKWKPTGNSNGNIETTHSLETQRQH